MWRITNRTHWHRNNNGLIVHGCGFLHYRSCYFFLFQLFLEYKAAGIGPLVVHADSVMTTIHGENLLLIHIALVEDEIERDPEFIVKP